MEIHSPPDCFTVVGPDQSPVTEIELSSEDSSQRKLELVKVNGIIEHISEEVIALSYFKWTQWTG